MLGPCALGNTSLNFAVVLKNPVSKADCMGPHPQPAACTTVLEYHVKLSFEVVSLKGLTQTTIIYPDFWRFFFIDAPNVDEQIGFQNADPPENSPYLDDSDQLVVDDYPSVLESFTNQLSGIDMGDLEVIMAFNECPTLNNYDMEIPIQVGPICTLPSTAPCLSKLLYFAINCLS